MAPLHASQEKSEKIPVNPGNIIERFTAQHIEDSKLMAGPQPML